MPYRNRTCYNSALLFGCSQELVQTEYTPYALKATQNGMSSVAIALYYSRILSIRRLVAECNERCVYLKVCGVVCNKMTVFERRKSGRVIYVVIDVRVRKIILNLNDYCYRSLLSCLGCVSTIDNSLSTD